MINTDLLAMSIGVLEKFYQHPDIPLEYELRNIKDRLCEIAEKKGIDTQAMVMASDYEAEIYKESLETLATIANYFSSGGSSRNFVNIMKSLDKDDN